MALNLRFTKLGLSSLPCKKCKGDTLHVQGICNACGTRFESEVFHREIGGREYHRIQGIKSRERRKERGA